MATRRLENESTVAWLERLIVSEASDTIIAAVTAILQGERSAAGEFLNLLLI